MKPKKRSAGAVKGAGKKDSKDLKSVQKNRVLRVKKKEDEQTGKGKGKGMQKKQQQKPKEKKPKTERDPDLPKKPATAFFYYMEKFRKTYQEENPGVTGMRQIGIACGAKWKEMTYEEKAPYYDIATQKRAEYEKILAAYKKKKEAGEKVKAHQGLGETNLEINDDKEGGEEAGEEVEEHQELDKTNSGIDDKEGRKEVGEEVEAHQGLDKTNPEKNDDMEGEKEAGEEVEVRQGPDKTNLELNDDKEGGEQENME